MGQSRAVLSTNEVDCTGEGWCVGFHEKNNRVLVDFVGQLLVSETLEEQMG